MSKDKVTFPDNLNPTVSVIILNWNGIRYLDKCLISVFNTQFKSFEVIFVDNGSTDGSVEFVQKRFGHDCRLKIIENRKNLGFAEGNNRGMKIALGEYIVLLNNDMEVDVSWLNDPVKIMDSDPRIGAAQGKILRMDAHHRLDSAGCLMDHYTYSYTRGFNEEDKGQYDRLCDVFYANAPILRRKALSRTGLLDPTFFIYCEDMDLSWRLWLAGYRVVFVPSSKTYHLRGGTVSRRKMPVEYFSLRNRLMMLIKNYERKNMIRFVAVFLAIEIRKAIIDSMQAHRPSELVTLSKAILFNVKNMRRIWMKRQTVQRLIRQVSDEYLMSHVMTKPYPPFPHRLVFLSRYVSKWTWRRYG